MVKNIIVVTKFGAIYTKDKSKFNITFANASLKLATNFAQNNCFSNFGYFSFREILRIPMGFDPVPFTANLFLYYCENKQLLDN